MRSSDFFSNPYLMSSTKILLTLYAAQIAPRAPSYITDLFNNTFVKIALIALIMYLSQHDFQFSLIFAIILVLGVNVASNRSMLESYSNINSNDYAPYSKEYEKHGNATLIEPQADIYPGCLSTTVADLLKIFENDQHKLQKSLQDAFSQLVNDKSFVDIDAKERLIRTARMAGLPYNIELNDENAPFVATLLLNYGFIVTPTCQAPNN